MSSFFRAGLMAAVGYIIVIAMFWLSEGAESNPVDVALPSLYALGNGMLSSALTLAGFYILGGLFGIVTILQLQDLSRLDHPLLRELLRRAPGTYHHSIMVANLAEQAAERIGANSTLVRVSAFYHDVGKMIRPPFFTENQEGIDPHSTLDPFTSARIIMNHVPDGLALAKQYHLPFRVYDIIAEHHGTRAVKSFYRKAQEAAGEEEVIDIQLFRYPGPRPISRESAHRQAPRLRRGGGRVDLGRAARHRDAGRDRRRRAGLYCHYRYCIGISSGSHCHDSHAGMDS